MEKVKTALIASGGGTDAYACAVMTAYNRGEIPTYSSWEEDRH